MKLALHLRFLSLIFSLFILLSLFPTIEVRAQDPSAILDLESTTQGALLPRMTTVERLALPTMHTPGESLIVYDTDTESFWYWKADEWVSLNEYAYESADLADSTATPIPDGDSIAMSLVSTDPGIIELGSHIRVCVDITHQFLEDIDLTLLASDGNTRVDLSSDNNGANYIQTCFEAVGPPITSGSAPYTGTWSPEESFDKLVGQTMSGTWTLIVADDNPFLDYGVMNYWSIEFDKVSAPQPMIANSSYSARVTVDVPNDSNQVGFYTSGSERMRIDQSGHIGIGTATPTARLSVVDNEYLYSIGDEGIFQVRNTSGNSYNLVMDNSSIQSRYSNTSTNNLKLQPLGGSVGIGTGSNVIYSPLHVASQGQTITNLNDNGIAMFGERFSTNMIFDHQTIQARDYPNIANLILQPLGGNVNIWDYSGSHLRLSGVGIEAVHGIGGTPSALHLNRYGGWIGINSGTNVPVSPLHIINGNTIYSPSDDGYFTIGDESGENITFDFKVIQARDNGQANTLVLNPYGGNVKIGGNTNSNVPFPLQVIGSSNASNTSPAHYLHSVSGVGSSGVGWHYSIHASSGVYSGLGFGTGSDARIKNIIGRSDGNDDLSRLMDIEITDYQMKDTLEYGNQIIKKVIAQQVENVMPAAVTQNVGIIPDIFTKSIVRDGWILLTTDLKVGEKVKIITDTQQGSYTVTQVKTDRFQIEEEASLTEGAAIFVYGREVSDFRSIDYDALSMLNISATQQQQQLIDSLQEQVNQLRKEKKEAFNNILSLEERLASLEAALSN